MDQRGKASGEDDTTELSPFPLKPGTAGAELAGLQLGQFVAAAGVAQGNRELVAYELAATAGEDRRTAGQTCALILATAGGSTSDAAAVRGDAGPDRCYRYRRDRWIVVQSATESVYSLVGVRRGVAKVGHKWGNFGLCRWGMAHLRECPR